MVEKTPIVRPAPLKKRKRSSFWLYALFFLLVLGGAAVLVFFQRSQAQTALISATRQMAISTVLVVHPERGSTDIHLVLPGTVQAEMESSVYAQVSGYVKRWLVDIGAPVKEGELLAEIETPVTDQQLMQAQAAMAQTEANLNLAKTTAARYNDLRNTNAVSKQDVDTQNAGVAVQEANLAAAQANVRGLEQTEAFKEVKAPFDGIVTARKIDVGDLVTASGSGTAAQGSAPSQSATPSQELFRVAQTKTLRVYVNIPENYSDEIVPGISATLDMASSPNQKVTGKLARTSESIDPNSLTLLAEVDVPNPDGKLLPGGYAQVHFDITANHPPLVIPGNALIFRAQGTQVGVVDTDTNTVHLKDIKIGRDFGTKLEVIDGLKEDDSVILNPSDSLTDGAKVQVNTQSQSPIP
ncbi:MAG TPA: efflux RND transporter periplasmic adaptor subunit [Candidatus Methylacidiphilales bacterium]|jgi:RND family efflux transporter MFP subunit|nr:efflux RND transporter periplasmic adaptor subunit [Candidatus Methylacidiphilales bacterium]